MLNIIFLFQVAVDNCTAKTGRLKNEDLLLRKGVMQEAIIREQKRGPRPNTHAQICSNGYNIHCKRILQIFSSLTQITEYFDKQSGLLNLSLGFLFAALCDGCIRFLKKKIP